MSKENGAQRLATLIVPTILQGQLTGVRAIRIGARKVHVELLDTAWKIPRSLLPSVLPSDYSELAELVRPLARSHGIEMDSFMPRRN